MGALLGLGPEGDLGVHHLGCLRRLPARPINRRVARNRASWIAILGLVTFLINYFGVNIFVNSLHSYAGL